MLAAFTSEAVVSLMFFGRLTPGLSCFNLSILLKKQTVGLLRSHVHRSNGVTPNGMLQISGFVGRRVSVTLLARLTSRFRHQFRSTKISQILAMRTDNVTVTTLMTRHFNIPVIFTGGSGADGVPSAICSYPIGSCARKIIGRIVIAGSCLGTKRNILLVSSFLTRNRTLANLVGIIRRTNTRTINTNVLVRGSFRPNTSGVGTVNVHIRSLTHITSVDIRRNIAFLPSRTTLWGHVWPSNSNGVGLC